MASKRPRGSGRGPYDRNGFLRRSFRTEDFTPVFGAGDAVGIANATASAQLVEAGAAAGDGAGSASATLVESGDAIGIAAATGSTEEDVENGTATGVAVASESGAVLVAAGAAGGTASAAAAPGLAAAGVAVGVGISSSSAAPILVLAGDASGIGSGTANPLAGFGVGEADASSDGIVVLGAGDAGGSASAAATAFSTAVQPLTARLSYGAFEMEQRVSAPATPPASTSVSPMLASGAAGGSSHATAIGVLLIPTPAAAVIIDMRPAPIASDDDFEMFMLLDMAA